MSIQQDKVTILKIRVTFNIHPAETLESVIKRLENETGQHIMYSTLMLLPYKSKAKDYKDVTVQEILDDPCGNKAISLTKK